MHRFFLSSARVSAASCSLVAVTALSVLAVWAPASTAYAADGDGDAVDDALDVFPCDASVSSMQAIPAENQFATLLYEDQWPSAGDYDFNDFVVDYNVEIYRNAAGLAKHVRLIFSPKAMGATFDNGFAVRLPVTKNAAGSLNIQRTTSGVGGTVVDNPSLVANENDVIVVVSDNIRSTLFSNTAGRINTVDGQATVAAKRVELLLSFSTPIALAGSDAPFDVFLFRSGQYEHQIHLPQFVGTNQMRQDLFGTLDDGSSASKKFVDTRGVPFVLQVPVSSVFPHEDKRIDRLFPRIVDFAQSSGANFANFFSVDVNSANRYNTALPAPASVVAHPQRSNNSCLVSLGGDAAHAASSCKAILDAGASVGTGVYFVDPDGNGGEPAFQAHCDMTSAGGGWMLVANRRQGVLPSFKSTGALLPTDDNQVITNERWLFMRNNFSQSLAKINGTTPFLVADMNALRAANCVPLVTDLRAFTIAHNENGGCGATGLDYSNWFGTGRDRGNDGRATFFEDRSSVNFYFNRAGTTSNFSGDPTTASMYVR